MNEEMLHISYFNEGIDGIDLFNADKLPHLVYTRSTEPLALHDFHTNNGIETVVYLHYIIEHCDIIVNFELSPAVLQQKLGPPPPNGSNTHCCATFAV